MAYRILVVACLFPTLALAGQAAGGGHGPSGCAGHGSAPGGVHGFSVAGNGIGISVSKSATGFSVRGHMPGGSQSMSVGPGPGSASATATSLGGVSATAATAAGVVSSASKTVSGAFGIGTSSSAKSSAGN